MQLIQPLFAERKVIIYYIISRSATLMIKKNYQYTDKIERIEYRKESCAKDTKINLNKEKKRGERKKKRKRQKTVKKECKNNYSIIRGDAS